MHGTFKQSNPVSDVLRRAADLMELHGHCKFTRRNDAGSMCILGAIEAAQNHRTTFFDSSLTIHAARAISDVLNLENTSLCDVADWNNIPERTGEEVIAVMRLAATVKEYSI